jgi:hypothetical protein
MTISESKYFIVSAQTAAQITPTAAKNTAHTEKTTTQAANFTQHTVSNADMIHSLTRLRQLLSVLRDTI